MATREVTISGRSFRFDARRVTRALARIQPEPVREHYVVVAGRRYPPKQVISVLTGLDRADFTTHQARRILSRLGFPAARRGRGRARGLPTQRRARRDRGVEELRPYIGRWVAVRDDEVLVAADSPHEIVSWLTQHGQTADSMFRVPVDEAMASGAAPA